MVEIKTVRDLYYSLPGDIAYDCLGKYNYNWDPAGVPEEEQKLCVDINVVLADLGYQLVDRGDAGSYNDIKAYLECKIIKM